MGTVAALPFSFSLLYRENRDRHRPTNGQPVDHGVDVDFNPENGPSSMGEFSATSLDSTNFPQQTDLLPKSMMVAKVNEEPSQIHLKLAGAA